MLRMLSHYFSKYIHNFFQLPAPSCMTMGGDLLCHPLPTLPPAVAHCKNLLATQTPACFWFPLGHDTRELGSRHKPEHP